MKKLFSIFFVLAMLLMVDNAKAVTSWSWSWDVFDHGTDAALIGYDGNNAVYKYEWWTNGNQKPCVRFVVCFLTANGVTYEGDVFPPKGTYPIQGAEAAGKVAKYQTQNNYDWVYNSSRWFSMVYNASNTQYKFYSGNVIFEEGATGPYIHTTSLKLMDSSANYYITSSEGTTSRSNSAGTFTITVGSAAVYRSITVTSNNAAYGSGSSAYKSGYVYANNRSQEYKVGSTYTLTATETEGVFVEWQKNGTRISGNKVVDVVIDNNATYTAIFTAANEGKISVTAGANGQVKLDNSSWGSNFNDTYSGGTNVQIAAQANNGYLFYQWNDGDSNNPRNITVSGDADYTATFLQAFSITTGVNDIKYGNVNITTPYSNGKYYAGQNITLTATPANKLCSFVKWQKNGVDIQGATSATYNFTVSESATYTAVFEGIDATIIDVQAAMTGNSGWDDYTFKYWAKTKDYDIHIIGANGTYTEGADFDISNVNTSASHIIDHGVTVTLTSDFEGSFYTENGKQVLEAMVTGSNGKKYLLTLRGKNVGDGNLSVGYADNFSQTYSNIYVKEEKETGVWRISGRNGTGETYTTTWCSHFFFATDISKCGDVPNGFYQVDDNGGVGTIITTDNSSYQSYGSYYVQSYIYYDLATGYAEVVNRDENYYIRFEGYHYRGYTHTAQIGTTPYSITGATSEGGHVDIVWHSANCGNVTYTTADMPQKFFSGNSITLTAVADDGYRFDHWADAPANTNPSRDINVSSTGTYTAVFVLDVPAVMPNITLCENCDNDHYNTFKANYDGETVNVTYNRRFTQSRWSTMCLPFNLDLAALITHKMYGRVYEFKYATGNANVGEGVNLYFSNAKSIEAGKCYIVNANSALAEKTSFVFSGVTIDLSKDNGADLSSPATPEASVAAYNALPGYKSEGTIELVGTLRNGILMGTATGNKYMGLKENKIYYPNTGTGSTIWAYRGIFRSTETLNVEKMRIVVDGEDKGEIRIDNGELIIDNGSPVRKFIRNGNLYIEREGVIYDAQGKRVE